jgi:hypothetical protein
VRHQGVVEKNKIDDDAAAAALEQSKAALERARRTLEGWSSKEIPFARRGDDLGKRNEDAGIDDQKDELAQLEKMYKADELVDDTEEIVLKRAKRASRSRRTRARSPSTARATDGATTRRCRPEVKKEAAKMQELALDRPRAHAGGREALARGRAAALEGRARPADQRSRRLQPRPREVRRQGRRAAGSCSTARRRTTVRAGRPRGTSAGSQLPARSGRLPRRRSRRRSPVAFDVPESMLGDAREGAAVEVKAIAPAGATGIGTVHLEPIPGTKVGEENGLEATAKLSSRSPACSSARARRSSSAAAVAALDAATTPAPTAAKSAP